MKQNNTNFSEKRWYHDIFVGTICAIVGGFITVFVGLYQKESPEDKLDNIIKEFSNSEAILKIKALSNSSKNFPKSLCEKYIQGIESEVSYFVINLVDASSKKQVTNAHIIVSYNEKELPVSGEYNGTYLFVIYRNEMNPEFFLNIKVEKSGYKAIPEFQISCKGELYHLPNFPMKRLSND